MLVRHMGFLSCDTGASCHVTQGLPVMAYPICCHVTEACFDQQSGRDWFLHEPPDRPNVFGAPRRPKPEARTLWPLAPPSSRCVCVWKETEPDAQL